MCVCFFHCSFVQFGMRSIDVVEVFEITIQTLRNDHAFSQPANQLECEQTDELKKKRTTANRYDLSKYCYCTLYLLYWLLLVGVYVFFLSLFYSGYCLVLKMCYYYFTIILAWLSDNFHSCSRIIIIKILLIDYNFPINDVCYTKE